MIPTRLMSPKGSRSWVHAQHRQLRGRRAQTLPNFPDVPLCRVRARRVYREDLVTLSWSSSWSLLCGQARRGQKLRVTRNFCGCAPDANTSVVVPGFRGASPCILWFPRVKSRTLPGARRADALRHEGVFVDIAKLCLKTSFYLCVPEVLRGSK